MPPKQPAFSLPTQLLFFIVLLYSFVFSCQQICNHQDQSALLAFSSNISTSPPVPLNWSSSINCCLWEGIKCNGNGRVTELLLPSRGLNGVINSSICSLASLRIIDLSLNSFLGSIPREIGKLSYLEKLHLYENNLSGPIPPSLIKCTSLVEILLRGNHLNGDISKLDFSRLVQLQKLDLRYNDLNGTFPPSIYSCKSLIAIGLAGNGITGQISPKIVQLNSLSFLSLSQNSFTNITTTLTILAKCKNLTSLLLSYNFYGESLPVHRDFIGSGEFSKLQFFFLENCKFRAGPIPNWLSTLKELCFLSLLGNKMTGRVPNWLGTLPNLFTLYLNNNSLSGEFPLQLCQLPTLIPQSVQADSKFFQFELPIILYPISSNSNKNHIIVEANFYHGIDLSHNSLTGNIPEEIGNLRGIQELDLSYNHFSGHIPISISNLEKLEVLNLSTNKLTGGIPTSLASLTFLSHFDVSYNDLEGPIPTGGQLSTFQESSFEGNLGLCGEPLNHSCSDPSPFGAMDRNGSTDDHNNMQQFLDGLFVGFASGFSGILIVIASYVWFNNCKRRRSVSSRRG